MSGECYYHKSYFMEVVYIVELQLRAESLGERPNKQDTGFCLWFWYMLYGGMTASLARCNYLQTEMHDKSRSSGLETVAASR
jgi:hypothetical protein